MPFPVTQVLDAPTFKSQIVDHYWSNLAGALGSSPFTCKHPNALPDDYAKIGAFLTDKDAVEAALRPLEDEIRDELAWRTLAFPETYAAAEPNLLPSNKGGAAVALKSHKLITNALRASEALHGFNHEALADGTFHDEAKAASGKLHSTASTLAKGGAATAVGKEKPTDTLSKAVALPRGAPTVLGDLDPLAFNVLLRHGYQFKDVAAGAYHGEYTHRLQWFAIVHGNLGLANSPLEILRSLGYMFAKADKNVPADGSKQLWMWQALFDTAETEADGVRLRTLAYTTNGAIFTCPENMNKSLMSVATNASIRTEPLWCLRVLLKTRWKKRYDEAQSPRPGVKVGMGKLKEQMAGDRTRAVISSTQKKATVLEETMVDVDKGPRKGKIDPKTGKLYQKKVLASREISVPTSSIDDVAYALAWYFRDDRQT